MFVTYTRVSRRLFVECAFVFKRSGKIPATLHLNCHRNFSYIKRKDNADHILASNKNPSSLYRAGIQIPVIRSMQSISSVEKNIDIPKGLNNDLELSAFNETFSLFLDTIRNELELRHLKEVADWIEKALYYNVPHGKKNRGIALIKTFQLVASESEINPYNLKLARLLGWCVEMLQAFLLIHDDIMDKSLTRRGQDCWYRVKGVGFNGINDGVLMNQAIFIILKKHFSHLPCYLDLIETFQVVTFWTSSGQCLDMLSTPNDSKPNLNSFTLERYGSIVIHKTAFYSIYLPIKLGVILACKKEAFTKDMEDILLSIGHYFQVQDDVLDCYGDPKVIGKTGRDIEEAKCSWLIVTAYNQASPSDKRILQENYGVNCEEAVSKVKQIYGKLDILSQFQNYELKTYANLAKRIREITDKSDIPAGVFFGLLDKILKRNK